MSAHMQQPAHILAVVRTALEGPSDPREVRPDNVWHEPRWSAISRAELVELPWSEQGKVWRRLSFENVEEIAGMLWDANAASVRHLYADADEAGMVADVPAFTVTAARRARRLTAADALCALAGYEYQACEHPDWHDSEALRFCEALRRALCDVIAAGSSCWSISDTVPA